MYTYRTIWIPKEGRSIYSGGQNYTRSNFTASAFDTEEAATVYAIEQAKKFTDREWLVVKCVKVVLAEEVVTKTYPITITEVGSRA